MFAVGGERDLRLASTSCNSAARHEECQNKADGKTEHD
jgi:hypothetical protein